MAVVISEYQKFIYGQAMSKQIIPGAAHGFKPVNVPALQPVEALRDIGMQIRAARRNQGLRIDDAASLCGVSVDLLSRLENGKGGIGTDKVLRVMSGLGLELIVAHKGHAGLRALLHEEARHG